MGHVDSSSVEAGGGRNGYKEKRQTSRQEGLSFPLIPQWIRGHAPHHMQNKQQVGMPCVTWALKPALCDNERDGVGWETGG